jgi:hypothetical protein
MENIPLASFDALPSQEEVEAARARLAALWAACQTPSAGRPFLVVTPSGMPHRAQIATWLAERGVRWGQPLPLPDWAGASTALYCRSFADERLQVALVFEALWRRSVPSLAAEVWPLAGRAELASVAALKDELRTLLGIRRYRVALPGLTIPTPGQVVRLQPLHAPDLDRYRREWCILSQLLA